MYTHHDLNRLRGKIVNLGYTTRDLTGHNDRERGEVLAEVGDTDSWGKTKFTLLVSEILETDPPTTAYYLFLDEISEMEEASPEEIQSEYNSEIIRLQSEVVRLSDLAAQRTIQIEMLKAKLANVVTA